MGGVPGGQDAARPGPQAYQVDGKFKFWGGLALHIWGGGPELLKALYANVERRQIPILFERPPSA